MALGRPRGQGSVEERWLEVDASMTGSLTFKDPVNLQINGQFDGTLEALGNLSIGRKARVKATIRAEAIKIAGEVSGTVSATSRVELLAGARVIGKVTSPTVVMQEGAVLHGTLEMVGETAADQGAWMTVEDLAKYLEVDGNTVIEWARGGRLPSHQQDGHLTFERVKIEEWLAHERIK